jgi:hypothetical protein
MDETMKTEPVQELSASLEDYLEAIFNLADESEGAAARILPRRSALPGLR